MGGEALLLQDTVAPSAPTAVPAPAEPRRWSIRRVQVLAAALLAGAMLLRPPASEFIFDGATYFLGAQALLDGASVSDLASLPLRGVLTTLLYLPAALLARLAGDDRAGVAVLLENALLIALIGAVLLPRVVAVWRSVTPMVVWVSSAGCGVALAGFAPHPLTDLWGVALLLLVLIALDARPRWWVLLGAGLCAGAAFNIRPATLLPLGAVTLALLLARRASSLWFVIGAAVALLPQHLFNSSRALSGLPVPPMTEELTQLQASYASYLVRYDTAVSDPTTPPSLAFCSPSMARALDGEAPSSPGDLAITYLEHLPQSLLFAGQKLGAALHWPLSTPFMSPAPVINGLFAALITAITVIGAAAVLRRAWERRRGPTLGGVVLLLMWAACLVGLPTSATETRFALPVVVLGIAGCALLADSVRVPRTRIAWWWSAGTAAAIAVVFALGVSGMAHPMDFVPSVEECAAVR